MSPPSTASSSLPLLPSLIGTSGTGILDRPLLALTASAPPPSLENLVASLTNHVPIAQEEPSKGEHENRAEDTTDPQFGTRDMTRLHALHLGMFGR